MRVYDLQPITLLALPLPSQSFTNSSADTLVGRLRSMQHVAQSGGLRGLKCHRKQATRITVHQHSQNNYQNGVVVSNSSISMAISYYKALSVESPLSQSVHQ